jgi:hypothetical protein
MLALFVGGCPVARNRAISTTRQGTVWDAQNETSMVRLPNGAGNGQDRLIVAYHDFAGTKEFVNGAYQIINGGSRMGWAYSDDQGNTWHAQPNIQADNADAGEVITLRGDPYVAQVNGAVFYLALASTTVAGPTDRIAIARLQPNSLVFEPAHTILTPLPNEGGFDGPKIAITQGGQDQAEPVALITWRQTGNESRTGYAVLSHLSGNISVQQRGLIDYRPVQFTTFAEPMGCVPVGQLSGISTTQEEHPAPAIGLSGMGYIGVRARFSPGGICKERRLEIYRADLRTQGQLQWTRILSQPNRSSTGTLIASGGQVARTGQWGAIGVSLSTGQEIVSILSETHSTDVLDEETTHSGLQFVRLPFANTCTPFVEGCNGATTFDPELSYQVVVRAGTNAVSLSNNRPGVLRTQPTLITRPDDSRVAAFWYAQPYQFRTGLPNNFPRYLTTVEGVFSTDGGASFGPLRRIAVPNDSTVVDQDAGGPTTIPLGAVATDASARGLGLMFDPCFYLARPAEFFIGDYISGAFLPASNGGGDIVGLNAPYQFYGTWTDSRHGCGPVPTTPQAPMFHQHVFGGAW